MRRYSAAVALLLSFVLTAGCQDERPGAVAPDEPAVRGQKGGGPQQGAAIEAQINALIEDLFPQPEQEQANELFASIKSSLAQGDTSSARDGATDMLQLAAGSDLNDPPGAQGLSELIALLADFTGLDVPEVPSEDLSADGDDGAIAFADPDDGESDTIVTEEKFAGTVLEDQDFAEELVVVIERLTQQEQTQLPTGECLPTDLDQKEGCYRFDRFPEGSFQDSTEVAVCNEASTDNFQLGKFEAVAEGGEGEVVFLPQIPAPYLDCAGFDATISSLSDGPAAWRLARRAWGLTGGRLLDWLGPAPLQAIDAGVGGTATNWSRIGWARPLAIEKTAGDGQQAAAGSTLPDSLRVEVSEAHGPGPSTVPGVDVEFTVVQGGGSVSPSTVTTDASGTASVSWTLGSSTGTKKLTAKVPTDSVIFTATAGGVTFSSTFVAVDAESDAYYTLDPSTGDTTFIRELDPDPNDATPRFTTPVSMAINSSNEVFVWNNTDPDRSLVQLDVCSGQPTVVDSLIDVQEEGALAFGPPPADTLYKFAQFDTQNLSKLYVLDPLTGAKVDSISFTQSLNVRGLSATAGGDLMAAAQTVDNTPVLYRLDPSSGTLDQIATFSQDIGVLGTLAFDDQGTLWGTGFDADPPQSADNIVFQVDTASAAVSGIQPTDQTGGRAPQGMAFFSGSCP